MQAFTHRSLRRRRLLPAWPKRSDGNYVGIGASDRIGYLHDPLYKSGAIVRHAGSWELWMSLGVMLPADAVSQTGRPATP